jgi:hypothetical protein
MTNQANAVTDVGMLLHIPTKVTKELTDKACLCIGSAIYEAKHKNETQISINIGIGVLSVDLVDMQCKFIPGKNLKTAIKNAMSVPVDPLELMLERAFADRLIAACEEVL